MERRLAAVAVAASGAEAVVERRQLLGVEAAQLAAAAVASGVDAAVAVTGQPWLLRMRQRRAGIFPTPPLAGAVFDPPANR